MKKYLVVYHAPASAMPQRGEVDPKEAQKGLDQWMSWAARCGDKLVDMGLPLVNGQKLRPGGKADASSNEVTGFSILQAEDMTEAKSLLVDHPHLHWHPDVKIEVHEASPMPGS
jgi:hypothetical protein